MKRIVAEFFGTLLIVLAVIGSGIMASYLTRDVLLQLLVNMVSTVATLYVAIVVLAPLSSANFNPLVSLLKFVEKKLNRNELLQDLGAQIVGAFSGAILAAIIFERDTFAISSYERHGSGTFVAEIIASAGLLIVALAPLESKSISSRAKLVSVWIGAAYFFTSSTSFANPVITFGRIFTESFSGIAPISFVAFFAAQIIGAIIALVALRAINSK